MSDNADKQEQKPAAPPPSQPEPTTPDPGNIEARATVDGAGKAPRAPHRWAQA